MILIRPGQWLHAAGRWFVWERILWKGYIRTPLCRVSMRYTGAK
jgi:hypothetical protein